MKFSRDGFRTTEIERESMSKAACKRERGRWESRGEAHGSHAPTQFTCFIDDFNKLASWH
jgi:hypothetical protein